MPERMLAELEQGADARLFASGMGMAAATTAVQALLQPGARVVARARCTLVTHSATKALNGHSDVLAGALVTRADDATWQRIRHQRHLQGAVPGPFEAWLLLRGMRTLFVRVERASAAALAPAERLAAHAGVASVLYPGLTTHPGHAMAARQMKSGFGSMLSILVQGGAAEALVAAERLQVFLRATSLGGVESLVEHCATVEGAGSLASPNLLRIPVGLESFDDLWSDLERALAI